MFRLSGPVLWVMVLLLGPRAQAQTNVRPGLEPDAPSYFHKGAWTLELAGGYVKDVDRGGSSLVLGTAGMGYYIDNTLSLRLEAVGYSISQDPDATWAGGLNLMARHHVLNGGDVSFFLDGGVGVIESGRRVPEGGTHFNFTPQFGLGLTYRLRERLHLIGGLRYFHLSNAQLQGRDRNPRLDAVEGYVGLMWELK